MAMISVSTCCGAILKWRARAKPTQVPAGELYSEELQISVPITRKQIGKTIRAYVCDNCGKSDR